MTDKTIAANSSGWTRFFSFIPEMMVGMDSKFYSFKEGNLYLHDAGAVNTFYGTKEDSTLRTVFNTDPTERKLFKAIALNGTSAWAIDMQTDIQAEGFIENAMFEKKEGVWYAYVRVPDNVPVVDADMTEFSVRSSIGIGSTVNVVDETTYYIFSFPAANKISSQVCVGDYVFVLDPEDEEQLPRWVGIYDGISSVVEEGVTNLVISKSTSEYALASTTAFAFAVKNRSAESSGIVGQICFVDLTLNPTASTEELFVIDAEVMQSYP